MNNMLEINQARTHSKENQMTFKSTRPNQTGMKLSDVKDRVVALKYISTASVMAQPDPSKDPEPQPVVKARVLSIHPETNLPIDHGQTLVFQDVLRDALIAEQDRYQIGRLVKEAHPTKEGWSYYILQDLEDAHDAANDKFATLFA
jgi:hypothetical protein